MVYTPLRVADDFLLPIIKRINHKPPRQRRFFNARKGYMKIGIQGGPASYHEMAAQQLHPEAEIIYFETFSELFKALRDHKVETILAAIANNRVQFIADPYEYLTADSSPYQIIGETYLRVEHALLAPAGATIEGITEVHSMAPALGQCSHFLENSLPQAHLIEETDTALAAAQVAQDRKIHQAAIASLAAGELHGLTVLKAGVQDDPDNITRFVEVRLKADTKVVAANKTTMMLQTPQVAGALLAALLPFKEAGINLSSLQSKLIPNSAFAMQFFIEFEAGTQEPRTQQVLDKLHNDGYQTHILGSYRQAEIPIQSNHE